MHIISEHGNWGYQFIVSLEESQRSMTLEERLGGYRKWLEGERDRWNEAAERMKKEGDKRHLLAFKYSEIAFIEVIEKFDSEVLSKLSKVDRE